jgi:hypothetical protein
MLEIVIAFLGLSFIWAYLYSKSDPTTLSGAVLRILYLGLTLLTIYELISFLIIYSEINKLPENVTNLVIGYMSVMNYVIFLIFTLILVFTMYNVFLPFIRRR